jgi:hypothetical protein
MHKLAIAAALSLLSLFAVEKSAHAAGGTGYACSVQYFPLTGTYGNYGYVSVTLYSGPSCSGSNLGVNFFCSSGASATYSCSQYVYSEATLMALFNSLRSAAATNQKMFIGNNPYYPGQAYPPEFYAAGY